MKGTQDTPVDYLLCNQNKNPGDLEPKSVDKWWNHQEVVWCFEEIAKEKERERRGEEKDAHISKQNLCPRTRNCPKVLLQGICFEFKPSHHIWEIFVCTNIHNDHNAI